MTRALAAALALPCAVAVSTAGAIWWNRSEVRTPMTLTERELMIDPGSDDDRAVAVRIVFQQWHGPATWLDRAKLAALGFDVAVDPASPGADRHYRRLLPKDRYVVLELAGPSWADLTADRQEHDPGHAARSSRLVAIDAGADPRAMAKAYPDGSRYLITVATVRPVLTPRVGTAAYVVGSIGPLRPGRIQIPPGMAPRLPSTSSVQVRLHIAYGRRFEPWVVRVEEWRGPQGSRYAQPRALTASATRATATQ